MNKRLVMVLLAGVMLVSTVLAQNHPNSAPISRLQETPLVYPFSFVVLGDTRPPGREIFAALREQMLDLDPAPRCSSSTWGTSCPTVTSMNTGSTSRTSTTTNCR